MTENDINLFEKIQAQLESLHTEISHLTKKSQNDALNKFKLKFVNQILTDANRLLGTYYRPFPDFEIFDDKDLPTNSDAALILGQYLNCMEKLRADNIQSKSGWWYWKSDEGETNIRTLAPAKIVKK
jgi:hypothetical protein